MKRADKYPPPTPEDVIRVESCSSKRKVHPLIWVAMAVVLLIGVGVYSDIVGFYEFDDIEDMLDDEHGDESDNGGDDDNEKDAGDNGKDD